MLIKTQNSDFYKKKSNKNYS